MTEPADDYLPITQRDWDMVRAALLTRNGWLCAYCDIPLRWKGSSIDHLIPRCQEGTDHYVNLEVCCIRCNSAKGGRNLFQWREPEAYRLECEAVA